MVLPSNVSTGRITGRFIIGVADGPDPDDEPDMIPAAGTITFTASVPYLPNPTATPTPVTILKTSIIGVLDAEGYLCAPSATDPLKAGNRGIRLIATDDPDLSVQDWTWTVNYTFGNVNGVTPRIATHSMALPSDATIDLTTVVKVPSSTGIGTEQAEALAAAAAESARIASEAAQATDAGVASLLAGDGATANLFADKVNKAEVALNVKDFGAKGDAQADDTAPIQAALNQAGDAADVRTVRLPRGTYRVSRLTLSPGVTLEGDGATIAQIPGGQFSTILIPVHAVGATVRDIEVDGNAEAQTNAVSGIEVAAERATVTGCFIRDTKHAGVMVVTGAHSATISGNHIVRAGGMGIAINGTAADPVRHTKVRDNHVEDATLSAFLILGVASHASFVGNTARNNGQGSGGYNSGNRHILFADNSIEGSGNNGVHLGGNHLAVVGNVIDGPTQYGIYLRNHDGAMGESFTVTGNTVSGSGRSGIAVDSYRGGSVSGNDVSAANDHGIDLGSTTDVAVSGNSTVRCADSGISLAAVARVAVSGGISKGNTTHGIDVTDTSSDVVIAGNVIEGNTLNGIRTTAGTNYVIARDNIIRNNAGGNLSIAPASGNRISDNVGPAETVASSAALPIPVGGGAYLTVTGLATISSISTTGGNAGQTKILRFGSACRVVKGGSLFLSSDFVGPGTLTLYSDSSNWFEVSRTSIA